MERRAFMATAAATAAAGLAGCSGDDDGDGGSGRSTEEALDSYRERLDTQLDVTIQELSQSDGVVTLVYESTHVADTSEWGYEVGFASGRFGRELSDGWDADRLDGTVTGADDRTFSWGVDAEDALAFVEGDVTASEFVDRIFESMSEE